MYILWIGLLTINKTSPIPKTEHNKKNKEKEDAKKKEQTYYESDMEETYTKAYEDSISKDFDDFMKAQKEKKEESKEDGPKDDVEAKRAHYQDTIKKIKEAKKNTENINPYYDLIRREIKEQHKHHHSNHHHFAEHIEFLIVAYYVPSFDESIVIHAKVKTRQ